jgi:hypothetical protein
MRTRSGLVEASVAALPHAGVRYDEWLGGPSDRLRGQLRMWARAELARMGRSQRWLADQVGVSQGYVSLVLTGERRGTLEQWHLLARAFGYRRFSRFVRAAERAWAAEEAAARA